MALTATTEDVLIPVLTARWKAASGKFLDLVKAIPDDRLESKLVNGTRTCGDVLRHVAYWNRYVANSLNGREAHDSANELPHDDYPEKARILEELEEPNKQIAEGINRNLDAKAMGFISMAFEHLNEHYGQLVVYIRLLGIIPPTSRS
jgi:uncharacterized damage-inducible protein DinB